MFAGMFNVCPNGSTTSLACAHSTQAAGIVKRTNGTPSGSTSRAVNTGHAFVCSVSARWCFCLLFAHSLWWLWLVRKSEKKKRKTDFSVGLMKWMCSCSLGDEYLSFQSHFHPWFHLRHLKCLMRWHRQTQDEGGDSQIFSLCVCFHDKWMSGE